MPLSPNMKALVYRGPGKLDIEYRPVPVPGPEEVLIRVHTVSICGSDLGAYRHGSDRFRPPLVLGHECAGTVAATGERVNGWQAGQRVTVNPMLFCRECAHCRRGNGNLCGNRRNIGTSVGGAATDGAMQEYMAVPHWALLELDDRVSFSLGALLEPMAVSLACAKRGREPGERCVTVVGAGPIGLLTVKFLKALGTERIVVCDPHGARLRAAGQCGADGLADGSPGSLEREIHEMSDGRGADRVILAAGEASTVPEAFSLLRSGGSAVLVALVHDPVLLDLMPVVTRGLNLLGSYMFTTEMREAMDMAAQGMVKGEDLITSRYPLEQGDRAFARLSDPEEDQVKVQLVLD